MTMSSSDPIFEAEVYQVGNTRITRIVDQPLENNPATRLYPDWQYSAVKPYLGALTSHDLTADRAHFNQSVHCWLVQTPHHTILIDTGAGNDKRRPDNPIFDRLDTPFLDNLARAGVQPEDVDYVLLTHLHVDHVGWNTRWQNGAWVPTFANAQYVFPTEEYRFYSNPANVQPPSYGSFEDSVQPIIDAGLAKTIEPDGREVVDGLAFHSSPGHSYAHASISLLSNGECALFGGDVLHTPVQVYCPDWNSVFCEFVEPARASRYWALNHAAEHDALYFSTHFAAPSAGRITRRGDGYAWQYEESGARS